MGIACFKRVGHKRSLKILRAAFRYVIIIKVRFLSRGLVIRTLKFLILGIWGFCIVSVSAQEPPAAIASDPIFAFKGESFGPGGRVGLSERRHADFTPSGITRSVSANVYERYADFSLKRPPEEQPKTDKPIWSKPEITISDVTRAANTAVPHSPIDDGFRWGPAVRQSLLFLAVQHGYALTQPKTQEALKGPFLKDYFESVRALEGWEDGGRFFTNYIAHPMQGSFMGFIQVQNDPRGMAQTFGRSGRYWKSRLKALAWSAAWSTQFEIGPISQASIGNVGLSGKQTYVDLVITPTVGLGMLIGEDILDKYIVRRLETRFDNHALRILARTLLNPTRAAANIIRFKRPWHRDKGLR